MLQLISSDVLIFLLLFFCFYFLQEELMSTELRGKMITFKLMLTRLLNLLAISKTAITHGVVSHLPFCEKRIVNIVSACRAQKLAIQAQGGQPLLVANARPTLQHSPDVSQIRLPSYVQGSGIPLPLSGASSVQYLSMPLPTIFIHAFTHSCENTHTHTLSLPPPPD